MASPAWFALTTQAPYCVSVRAFPLTRQDDALAVATVKTTVPPPVEVAAKVKGVLLKALLVFSSAQVQLIVRTALDTVTVVDTCAAAA